MRTRPTASLRLSSRMRISFSTAVGNFPRLMKFGHFHTPKSWSLLHLWTWFFFQELSDEQLWPWKFFYTNLGEIQPIWKIVEKCHFWTLGRILSPCRCNWKNTKPMVKVVHHTIPDKIKKNQVNMCSRLQDLGAWKWPNFIRRGKLPTTVKDFERIACGKVAAVHIHPCYLHPNEAYRSPESSRCHNRGRTQGSRLS